MKTLVTCYSFTGINRKLAQEISEKIKADYEEIAELVERKGFWKTILVGGFQSMKKIATPIKPLKKDLAAYERVVVFTPVWAGAIPPATRAFLNQYANNLKKLDFVFVCGQGEANERKIVPELEKIIKKNHVSALFVKRNEVDLESSQQQIFNFLNSN